MRYQRTQILESVAFQFTPELHASLLADSWNLEDPLVRQFRQVVRDAGFGFHRGGLTGFGANQDELYLIVKLYKPVYIRMGNWFVCESGDSRDVPDDEFQRDFVPVK